MSEHPRRPRITDAMREYAATIPGQTLEILDPLADPSDPAPDSVIGHFDVDAAGLVIEESWSANPGHRPLSPTPEEVAAAAENLVSGSFTTDAIRALGAAEVTMVQRDPGALLVLQHGELRVSPAWLDDAAARGASPAAYSWGRDRLAALARQVPAGVGIVLVLLDGKRVVIPAGVVAGLTRP